MNHKTVNRWKIRNVMDGDVAHLVERRTGTLVTQVRFSGAARDFSPRVNFQLPDVQIPGGLVHSQTERNPRATSDFCHCSRDRTFNPACVVSIVAASH